MPTNFDLSDMAATYCVHSLDNLDTCQNEILNTYRFDKDPSSCGLLLRGPSSSLLTVGLSGETQIHRIGSQTGESFETENAGVIGILKPTSMSTQPFQASTANTTLDSKLQSSPFSNSGPSTPSLLRATNNAVENEYGKLVNGQPGCIMRKY